MAEIPYNPLDKINLGNSVASALLLRPVFPLRDRTHLVGAGVYALYYVGPFPAYAEMYERNKDNAFAVPIYVGKAIPEGGRKGGIKKDAAASGRALRNRLGIHASSIDEADNLDLGDFYYRCLVVDDIWIPLGENMLIEAFKPVWNMMIDGFGNKTPGAGRAKQARSMWDTLHPGRSYVDRLGLGPGLYTPEEITLKLEAFFAGKIVPSEPVDTGD